MAELVPVGLLAAGLVYQLWRLRRDARNPVVRCLAVMFGVLVVAVGIGLPGAYLAVDRLVGEPNAARLVQHVCAITAFCVVQILFLYVGKPDERARAGIRPRVGSLVAVVAVMTVLFGLAPVDTEAPADFVERYAAAPWVGPYVLVYLAYLAIGVVDVIRSCLRLVRESRDRPWLRASFALLVLAGSIGLVYVLAKAAFTVAAWAGLTVPVREGTASATLVGLGAVFAAIGVLLPAIGARVTAARQRRLYRRLGPLWTDVTSAVPRVVLTEADQPDLTWRLYRRTVEIQDGLLDLRFYRDPAAGDQTAEQARRAGVAGEDLRAVVAAAQIAAALRSRAAGHPASAEEDPPPLIDAAADMRTWLGRVADAYARSPHVAAATRTPAAS